MSTQEGILETVGALDLDEVVRTLPTILDRLRSSYEELEARAARVEDELCLKVEELDGLHRHLEAVLESLPCGVVVRDAGGAIVDANAAAQRILGTTAAELRAAGGHVALRGAGADGEAHEIVSDGRRLVVASSYSPMRRADGDVDGSVEILDDRTEQAELQERLHAQDKMAALGTMAAGIAHEIRNPLNAVKGFASLLTRRPHLDAKSARWCGLIVDATSEADAIIQSMLTFGSPERLLDELIDAEDLADNAVRLALPDDSTGVTVERRIEVEAFVGDRIKLRQAIRNLIANAIHAQLDTGSTARVALSITREDGSVLVRVSDAGPGVDPELRQRIFDPFFTNHPDGTGLGLALVSTIVRLHGGSVRVSPEPSDLGGAEFVIQLPQPAHRPAAIPQSRG